MSEQFIIKKIIPIIKQAYVIKELQIQTIKILMYIHVWEYSKWKPSETPSLLATCSDRNSWVGIENDKVALDVHFYPQNTFLSPNPMITAPLEFHQWVEIYAHTWALIAALLVITKTRKQTRCPSSCEFINKLWQFTLKTIYQALEKHSVSLNA